MYVHVCICVGMCGMRTTGLDYTPVTIQ